MRQIMALIHKVPKERQDVCTTHGPFTAKCYLGDVWTSCPVCLDQVKQQEIEERRTKAQEELKKKWIGKVGAACIPERFQTRTLKSFVADTDAKRNALQFAVDYAENFSDALKTGRSAVFIGKPGTGKTHLAVGIALRLMHKQNRVVYFTTVQKAINRVKATWQRGSEESENDAIGSMAMPDLLILDEVGIQFGSEAEKVILFQIINERYERMRPTLLMSNLSLDKVRVYLGDRIVDRLKEDGGKFVVFDWESYRANGDR